jgi:hypothetical protein
MPTVVILHHLGPGTREQLANLSLQLGENGASKARELFGE